MEPGSLEKPNLEMEREGSRPNLGELNYHQLGTKDARREQMEPHQGGGRRPGNMSFWERTEV